MTDSRINLAELLTAFFTRHLAAELNARSNAIKVRLVKNACAVVRAGLRGSE